MKAALLAVFKALFVLGESKSVHLFYVTQQEKQRRVKQVRFLILKVPVLLE